MSSQTRILSVSATGSAWLDRFGAQAEQPTVTLGCPTTLVLDLRDEPDDAAGQLPRLPPGALLNAASFSLAVDNDYDPGTAPRIIRLDGIRADDTGDATLLTVELPDFNLPAIRDILAARHTISVTCEVAAYGADGATTFVAQFPVTVRNRIWLPGDAPPAVESDPEYLTSAQVAALVNAAVADATAGLKGEKGDSGGTPEIVLGDVASGPLAATLVPDAERDHTYILSLSIPTALEHGTAPLLAIGFVSEGDAPAADIAATADGYVLSLTIPRGRAGEPLAMRGQWSADQTYTAQHLVRHGGATWMSLHADNLANQPPAVADQDDHWALVARDGQDAIPLFQFSDSPTGPWHVTQVEADRYARISTDAGLSYGPAFPLSAPGIIIEARYNPTTDGEWETIAQDKATDTYATARNALYLRCIRDDGRPSSVNRLIDASDASPVTWRVFFGDAAATIDDTSAWSPVPGPLDSKVYLRDPEDSSHDIVVSYSLTEGHTVLRYETSCYEDPWHPVPAADDRYLRLTVGDADPEYIDLRPETPTVSIGANGNWIINGEDTGTCATGPRGPQGTQGATGPQGPAGDAGARGADGADGKDGTDGVSPTATIVKSGSVATITITDLNGTTTAEIRDGADGGVDLSGYATTGDLANLADDLENGLAAKADRTHTHTADDITGLDGLADLAGLADALAAKADRAHTHTIDDITGLADTLAGTVRFAAALPSPSAADAPALLVVTGEGETRGHLFLLQDGAYVDITPATCTCGGSDGGGEETAATPTGYLLVQDMQPFYLDGLYVLASGTEGTTDAVYQHYDAESYTIRHNGSKWVIGGTSQTPNSSSGEHPWSDGWADDAKVAIYDHGRDGGYSRCLVAGFASGSVLSYSTEIVPDSDLTLKSEDALVGGETAVLKRSYTYDGSEYHIDVAFTLALGDGGGLYLDAGNTGNYTRIMSGVVDFTVGQPYGLHVPVIWIDANGDMRAISLIINSSNDIVWGSCNQTATVSGWTELAQSYGGEEGNLSVGASATTALFLGICGGDVFDMQCKSDEGAGHVPWDAGETDAYGGTTYRQIYFSKSTSLSATGDWIHVVGAYGGTPERAYRLMDWEDKA